MADIMIETERLILRTVEDGDVALFNRHINTPTVMRHLGGPLEQGALEEKLARTQAQYAREGFGFGFVIEKGTGEFVGQCGLKRVDASGAKNIGEMEVGWLIREDRWRRGYAHEMARAAIAWAFTRFDAPLVVAMTQNDNLESWRLMEKLGMQRREDLDFDDARLPPEKNPSILYSIDRAAWEKQQ